MANQPHYNFINVDKAAFGGISCVEENEIYHCGQACGNGWRKVFNVYAKFVFALASRQLGDFSCYAKWQDYRDDLLLREHSKTALIFSQPVPFEEPSKTDALHIIMGKAYAQKLLSNNHLDDPDNMIWLNSEFAINTQHRIIICPYFDYRQLSNVKILYLVDLIQSQLSYNR